jgi:hypothetical protein
MKYLKTYEGIIKASEATYLPVSDDIIKIVSDPLRNLSIYQKDYMQKIIDNVFDDIELIWTDLKDELDNVLSVGIERCNTRDDVGKNLNDVIFNRLLVLMQTPYHDLNEQEVYAVIDANKRCEEITGSESTLSGRDPKYYGISKYSTLGYYYEFNDCINFWEKVRYNTGEEQIRISLYHFKYGSKIMPITWEKTLQIKDKLEQDIKPKLRELGIAPIISYGGSVGASGKKDTIDIKFFKLK